jgi:hypothetical protein
MSSFSLRLVTGMPEIFSGAKDNYDYGSNGFPAKADSNIGKYYSSKDFKLTGEFRTNYLSDPSPIGVDQVNGPSPTLGMESSPRDDGAVASVQVKVTPSYFVGTSSSELSSSYSEPSSMARYCGQPLTRQRSMTLPDHNKLDCYLMLEPTAAPDCDSPNYAEISALVEKADNGLQNGVLPLLADGALGGTYFLRDRGRAICLVCKPGDEEPNAVNNPHQQHREGSSTFAYKGSIEPSSGMYREVAAYLLDKGFAGVPTSHLAKICHPSLFRSDTDSPGPAPGAAALASASVDSLNRWKALESKTRKLCSVQQYARHECCAEDMGSGKFSAADVQKLAFTDIRLLNLDRHEGNVLVTRANPFQQTVPTATAATTATTLAAATAVSAATAGCLPVNASTTSLASMLSEASVVTVSNQGLGGLSKARLIAGPIVIDCGQGPTRYNSASPRTLSTSAPSAMASGVSDMGSYFGQIQNLASSSTDSTKVPSPRSTYASVTGGPSYVHPSTSHRLIPIDHGYCLPHILHIENASLCWLNWTAQSDAPILPDVMHAIEAIDVEADMDAIRRSVGEASIPLSYLLSLHVGAALLKCGAHAGLTLAEIGAFLTNGCDEVADEITSSENNYDDVCYDKPARVQAAVESALTDTFRSLRDNVPNNCGQANEFKSEQSNSERGSVALNVTSDSDLSKLLDFALQSAGNTSVFLYHLLSHVQALVDEKAKTKVVRK